MKTDRIIQIFQKIERELFYLYLSIRQKSEHLWLLTVSLPSVVVLRNLRRDLEHRMLDSIVAQMRRNSHPFESQHDLMILSLSAKMQFPDQH